MMYDEFKDLVRARGVPCDISYSDYQTVEFIYMWHPCIKGKDTIVDLWLIGGRQIMRELKPRAKRYMERDREKAQIKARMRELQIRLGELEENL